MKYGVLVFSYKNFESFGENYAREGLYDINLGDYVQTLAVRSLYRELGIPDHDIVDIDRDTISSYDGEPVIVPMNACFFSGIFPLPKNILPVFVGFQASAEMIEKHQDYLRAFDIGCRDIHTKKAFEEVWH